MKKQNSLDLWHVTMAAFRLTIPAPWKLSALLALSGSRSSSREDDYFSLKSLEGTQVRMCYSCGQAIRVPPKVPPPPNDLCVVNKEFRSYRKADGSLIKVSRHWASKLPLPPIKAKVHWKKTPRLHSIGCKNFTPYKVKSDSSVLEMAGNRISNDGVS